MLARLVVGYELRVERILCISICYFHSHTLFSSSLFNTIHSFYSIQSFQPTLFYHFQLFTLVLHKTNPLNPINMRYTLATAILATAAFASANQLDRRADCASKLSLCQSGYNANLSTCASEYAQCMGPNGPPPPPPHGGPPPSGVRPSGMPPMKTGTSGGDAADAANGAGGAKPSVVVVTETVDSYTTYCPYATAVVQNGVTWSASASETLTITDCPCTITRTSTVAPTATWAAAGKWAGASSSSSAPCTTSTGAGSTATWVVSGAASATGAAKNATAYIEPFTGAGSVAKPVFGLLALGAGAVALL